MEAHREVAGEYAAAYEITLVISEHIFTILFTVELIMRLGAQGIKAYWPADEERRWNFLDMILVFFTGILTSWLIPGFCFIFGLDSNTDQWRILTVLRGMRLTRLV